MTATRTINLCTVQGSVTCKYKRNLKPVTRQMGCGFDGECVYKAPLEVKNE